MTFLVPDELVTGQCSPVDKSYLIGHATQGAVLMSTLNQYESFVMLGFVFLYLSSTGAARGVLTPRAS
jgi:hypothetical protein